MRSWTYFFLRTFWQITLSTLWNWPIRTHKTHPPTAGGFIGVFFAKFSTHLTLSEPTELRLLNENAIFHMTFCARSCSHNFGEKNGGKCCPGRSHRPRNVRFSQNVSKFELQMGWRPSWNYHFHKIFTFCERTGTFLVILNHIMNLVCPDHIVQAWKGQIFLKFFSAQHSNGWFLHTIYSFHKISTYSEG